jgi:hypothetical protein
VALRGAREALLFAACLAATGCAAEPNREPTGAAVTARAWLERGDAIAFESALAADPERALDLLRDVGDALAGRADRRDPIAAFVAEVYRRHLERLADEGPARWRADEPRLLLALAVFDPARYARDAAFRDLVAATDFVSRLRAVPGPLRGAVVEELGAQPAAAFDLVEQIAVDVGAAPRSSRPRDLPFSSSIGRCAEGGADPIEASFFVLRSEMFYRAEVTRFLAAVVALAPDRTVVVVTDESMRHAIAAVPALASVRFVATLGRNYSPWPRDPFLFCRRADGGLSLLARPYRQPGREADADLARTLVQGLPEALDRAWGGARWSRAPIPFHNGQVLFADDAAWLSIHSVELLVLQSLRLDRVPVQEFRTAAGVARYMDVTRASATELGRLYGVTPRFVHSLEPAGASAEPTALMHALGGGAGFDLDSLLTVLPSGSGTAPTALVADVAAGRRLVTSASAADLESLREAYGFVPTAPALREVLGLAQQSERARRLGSFVDLVASHLTRQGLRVIRLPLLLVPSSLVRDGDQSTAPDFLLTWNNVVLERRHGALRAEGFTSGLPLGDATATATFARAGCELRLLPLLPRSVVLNGGYRCASNHLRAPIRE